MKKELTRFELAAVKRTAQNVKSMRNKQSKLEDKQALLTAEINQLAEMINDWEQPIIKMTGGFTSDQVLNGEMDILQEEEPIDGEVDDSSLTERIMTSDEALGFIPEEVE